jgi:hypothetical protein
MGDRRSEHGSGRCDLGSNAQDDELSSDADPRLPVDFTAETGNSRSTSKSSGNEIHIHGLTPGQGLAIAALAALALGVSITNMMQSAQAQADMRSRYEQSYRELATKVALNTNATDDMRASLIARGINPNNHDITDAGGNKP